MKQIKQKCNLSFHVTFWLQTSWNFSNSHCRWKWMWGTWKGAPSTLLNQTSKKGQHRSKVCCPSLSWGSFLESWSQHLCHHLQVWTTALDYHWTCHVGAQTHCLTGDKHLGCYILLAVGWCLAVWVCQLHRERSLFQPLELGRWKALVLLEIEGFDGVAMEVGSGSFI